jgi:uncharacterized membrane protein YedE/YeeE
MSAAGLKSAATRGDAPLDTTRTEARGLPASTIATALVVGVYFGVVLVKSEVVRWQRIHDMFLFREARMYLIMAVAIGVAMVSMQWIRRGRLRSLQGQPIVYHPKPYHKGIIIGGILFGAGWAITGSCPGPIYAQLGAGEWLAGFTLVGALAGMFAYAYLRARLPH